MNLLCVSREGRIISFDWTGMPVGHTIEMSVQRDHELKRCLFHYVPPVDFSDHDLLFFEETV